MSKKKNIGKIVLGASLIGLAYLIYKTQKTKATSQQTPTQTSQPSQTPRPTPTPVPIPTPTPTPFLPVFTFTIEKVTPLNFGVLLKYNEDHLSRYGWYYLDYKGWTIGAHLFHIDASYLRSFTNNLNNVVNNMENQINGLISLIQSGTCLAECNSYGSYVFMPGKTCDEAKSGCIEFQKGFVRFLTVDDILNYPVWLSTPVHPEDLIGFSIGIEGGDIEKFAEIISSKIQWVDWKGGWKDAANKMREDANTIANFS